SGSGTGFDAGAGCRTGRHLPVEHQAPGRHTRARLSATFDDNGRGTSMTRLHLLIANDHPLVCRSKYTGLQNNDNREGVREVVTGGEVAPRTTIHLKPMPFLP